MIYPLFKRIFDFIFALVFIVFLSPLYVVIFFFVVFSSGLPVLYKGIRAGVNNSQFHIYKFRTMLVNAEQVGGYSTAHNDPRLTPFGRFLRKYKLDELPQFFNVLVGQMSFVGPRPQVLFYTQKYNSNQQPILSVRPGITDLATLKYSDMDAVLGSGSVDSYYEHNVEPVKNRLRLAYVKNQSFILDAHILLATAAKLVHLSSISRNLLSSFEEK
jgi:lipopolysaccharide/colanic/teichoic acid biosynthesis glycosyltransferase